MMPLLRKLWGPQQAVNNCALICGQKRNSAFSKVANETWRPRYACVDQAVVFRSKLGEQSGCRRRRAVRWVLCVRHFWGSPCASECPASQTVTEPRVRRSPPSVGPPDSCPLSICSGPPRRSGSWAAATGQPSAACRTRPAPGDSPTRTPLHACLLSPSPNPLVGGPRVTEARSGTVLAYGHVITCISMVCTFYCNTLKYRVLYSSFDG